MAYDDFLVDQVKQVLNEKKILFEEKKMMGGLCFMVDGKMCMGVSIDKTTFSKTDSIVLYNALFLF